MAFKVNNKRNDDGTYTLSYGKGGNKLTAIMRKDDDSDWYVVPARRTAPPSIVEKTMKECKAAWGEWAEQSYKGAAPAGGGRSGHLSAPTAPAPVPPPPSLEPPSLDDVQPAFRDPDPFDPAFRDTPGGPLKPLGALDAIYSWMRGHQHQVLHPTLNILTPPWDQVYEVLRRELGDDRYPEIKKP